MSERYTDWICWRNLLDDLSGMCAQVTNEMLEAFPELRRVRGHFHTGSKRYAHWWLETASGEVIDPTAAQFAGMLGWYEPHNDQDPEPTGKCPNCGNYCYDGGTVCSDLCAREYAAYCMSGTRLC